MDQIQPNPVLLSFPPFLESAVQIINFIVIDLKERLKQLLLGIPAIDEGLICIVGQDIYPFRGFDGKDPSPLRICFEKIDYF
jgi:hypothetical protein